jgi:hypothetical protein
MVVFVAESREALDEEEDSSSFDDSEDSLTGKLSIDDYVVGDTSDSFYEGLLAVASTQLERILDYSTFDFNPFLCDLDDEANYSFDSSTSDDDYDNSTFVGESSSGPTQQDLISFFIEKMLDYVNPSVGIDEVNDCREDGDDVSRRARRWQFETNFNVAGSEIALYREQCEAFEASGYRKFLVLRN